MDISKIVMEFTKDIMKLVHAAMDGKDLDNNKSGSDIYKNLQVKATNDGDLVFDITLRVDVEKELICHQLNQL